MNKSHGAMSRGPDFIDAHLPLRPSELMTSVTILLDLKIDGNFCKLAEYVLRYCGRVHYLGFQAL